MLSSGETDVLQGGNADSMGGNHGEVVEPSTLMGDNCVGVLSTRHNSSNPGERHQIRNVLHVSGEERMMAFSSSEESLSEEEEIEIVDSLTGMGEETDVSMAEEDVDGLVDDSERAMNVSQAQPPNLLLVPSDSPDPTWVINHCEQEAEMEARDIDNIGERNEHGSDQNVAAPSGLYLDVALPRSAIPSCPTLVFLPEAQEATVVFFQEGQSVLYSPQDDIPDRLAKNTTVPWTNSSQKPTTNNRGEEVELMNINANGEGDDGHNVLTPYHPLFCGKYVVHPNREHVFPPQTDDSTIVFSPVGKVPQEHPNDCDGYGAGDVPVKSARADPTDKLRNSSRGMEVELTGVGEGIANEEQFLVGRQPLNERGEEVEIVPLSFEHTQGIPFAPMNVDAEQLDEQMVLKEHHVVRRLPLNDRGEEVEIGPFSNDCTLGIPFTTMTLNEEMETTNFSGVDDVPTHSLLSFDSEAVITLNRPCTEAEVEALDKSRRKIQGINPLVFLPDHDDHEVILFEKVTKKHFPEGHGVKLTTSLSKLIPKRGNFLPEYGRDSSNAPQPHPATLFSKDSESHFDVRLSSDHDGRKRAKSLNPNRNVYPPPSISVKDLEDDIVMNDCNNSEVTNSFSPDEQTPPALHRPPLVFLKDVDDGFVIDLPHGSDSENSVESDEESDHSDAPLVFPNEADQDFILNHDVDNQSGEFINLDDLVDGSDDESSHQTIKQNIFHDPLMVRAYLYCPLHLLKSLQLQEAHYYDLINCPSV